MNTRLRSPLAIAILVALAVVVAWVSDHGRKRRASPGASAAALVNALARYARDCCSHGQPLPASTTVRSLVQAGYLTAQEASAFDGVELTLYPIVDPTRPTSVLADIRTPNGDVHAVQADGSVLQVTPALLRARYLQALSQSNATNQAEDGTSRQR